MSFSSLRAKRHWKRKMKNAENYKEWSLAARELDRIDGMTLWKQQTQTNLFDYEIIRTRLEQFYVALESKDTAALSFLLRTSLERNFGGIGNNELYKSRIGTMRIIEEFNEVILSAIELVAKEIDTETNPMVLREKMDFFKDLRHGLGNTALLFSGGGSLGSYHIGVVKALWENGLLPRILAGSSSGSILAAVACCNKESDWPDLFTMKNLNFNMFENPIPEKYQSSWLYPLKRKFTRLFSNGVLFDNEILKQSLRENIGDITFLEAYRKSNHVLNISVTSSSDYDMPSLLNYITAPNVLVWSAVVASCAVPGLFESAPLMAKDHNGNIVAWDVTGDRWRDGSLEYDLPMRRITEIFNVNHFIVSQVNPHVFPFVKHAIGYGRLRQLTKKLTFLVKSEIFHRLEMISDLGIFPRLCQALKNILGQKYYGDITVVPDISWSDLAHFMFDRPLEARLESVKSGERSIWPKLSIIRNQIEVELVLDDILLTIRDRLFDASHENSAYDLPLRFSAVSEDVMFDPTVDVRRHLTPIVSSNHNNNQRLLANLENPKKMLPSSSAPSLGRKNGDFPEFPHQRKEKRKHDRTPTE